MGFFDSKSTTKNYNTFTSETESNSSNQQNVSGVAVGGQGNTLNMLDGGAIKGIAAMGAEVLDTVKYLDSNRSGDLKNVLKFAEQNADTAFGRMAAVHSESISSLAEFAKTQSTNNDERITKIAMWAVGGAIAIAALPAIMQSMK